MEINIDDCLDICFHFLFNSEKAILEDMVPGDEKWIEYENVEQKWAEIQDRHFSGNENGIYYRKTFSKCLVK